MPVTVATASIQPAPIDIRAVGVVEPSTHIEVKSQIAGQIMSVHFIEGQDVNEGQALFDIDSRPYQDSLEQAEARMHEDKRLGPSGEIPFDSKRLILGCFKPLYTMGRT